MKAILIMKQETYIVLILFTMAKVLKSMQSKNQNHSTGNIIPVYSKLSKLVKNKKIKIIFIFINFNKQGKHFHAYNCDQCLKLLGLW